MPKRTWEKVYDLDNNHKLGRDKETGEYVLVKRGKIIDRGQSAYD